LLVVMRGFVFALFCAAVVALSPEEEAFTIFISLDDFHVTQAGNHEFLPEDAIGTHDNVVLHMSEDEVKFHQKIGDSHDCEHPAEVHEVVSFIQENMYDRPMNPDFIDDTISDNYGTSERMWEDLMGAGNMMQGDAAPLNVPDVPATAGNHDAEEEAAVAKFREAYHTHKSMMASQPAQGAFPPEIAAMMGAGAMMPPPPLFGKGKSPLAGLLGGSGGMPSMAMAMGNPNNLENEISRIVDDTYKNVMTDLDGTIPQQDEGRHHHHHHHHHSEEDQLARVDDIGDLSISEAEKSALAALLGKVGSSEKGETLRDAMRELLDGPSSSSTAPAATPSKESSPSVAAGSGTRPSAPVFAKVSDMEAVYGKGEVPFQEVLAQTNKHVAKRVLIPRMEEPGPAIGGSSKTMHIHFGDESMPEIKTTRPSPPNFASINSDITVAPPASASAPTTSAADVKGSSSLADVSATGLGGAGGASASTKPSTLAAVNDEALTAPEVVIFKSLN